jgi:prepilin-type N-terminal cleavage/methylation domain-containing protein
MRGTTMLTGRAPSFYGLSRGLTIVEVMIAMAVLSIGLLGLVSSLVSSMTTLDVNREETLAINAARQKIAELENATFGNVTTNTTVFDSYNTQKASYTPNANNPFKVAGLPGAEGTVIFPVNAAGNLDETIASTRVWTMIPVDSSTGPVAETVEIVSMGGGRVDIDGDGVPSLDPTITNPGSPKTSGMNDSYQNLPVRVRIRWISKVQRQPMEVNFSTCLSKIK